MRTRLRKFLSLFLSLIIGVPAWLFGQGAAIAMAAAPIVDPSDIQVISANPGVLRIGDQIAGEFDDSGNSPAATSVFFDFSEFGGGIVTGNETAPGSRKWAASYTILEGTIASGMASVKVTVTNADGTVGPVEDDWGVSVDNVRPTLIAAQTVSTNNIELDFSEKVDPSSAAVSDFVITAPDRSVSTVVVDSLDQSKVYLETSSAFNGGDTPTVTVSNVCDKAGNAIVAGSQKVAADGISPQVGFGVQNLTYDEGKNDRDDILTLGFTEDIAVFGSAGDYSVIYDEDGNLSTSGDQRAVSVIAAANPESDSTVSLTISDQSGENDAGGRFIVNVINPIAVSDGAGNTLDPSAAEAISDLVATFDSYTPVINDSGVMPNNTLLGIGADVLVYVKTDDGSNDKYLGAQSGTMNGHTLSFAYNAVSDRYEAVYHVSTGDLSGSGIEAENIVLKDRAGNISNEVSTSGSLLDIDTIAPNPPVVTDPSLPEAVNADAIIIYGDAETDSTVKIYSDPDNDGDQSDGVLLGSTIATNGNFEISVSLLQDSNNYFVVTATDLAGNQSAPADVPTITEDSLAPSLPTQFSLVQDGDYITLTWSASQGADHYEIWRSSSPYQLIATVSASTLVYTDKTVAEGTKYYYKVVAVDAAGNKTETSELSISTPSTETSESSDTDESSVAETASEEQAEEVSAAAPLTASINTPSATATSEIAPDSLPQVEGAETEQGSGESWWPLLIPIALVLAIGAIFPLSATTAIATPIVGAVISLVVAGFTSGNVNPAYIYLILGGETIALLLINYGLMAASGESAETVVAETKTEKKKEEKEPNQKSSSQQSKRKKNKKKKK